VTKLSSKQIAILGGVGLLVLVVLVLIFNNLRSSEIPPKVTLKVWVTSDNDAINRFRDEYSKNIRKNVEVDYKVLPAASYEEAVVSALAAGEGPDVFMIPSKSLSRNQSKLYPAPAAQFSLAQLREQFPKVVEQDFVDRGQVYALPLYIDTLALIYNRALLDRASLVRPPQTWEEFRSFVPYLRAFNEVGQITRAAAAIGGSEKNVPHAPEILMNLMLQNGLFAGGEADYYGFAVEGGLRAMNFYIQFANSTALEYTWNDAQPDAYENFGAGKTAMVFGYRKDVLELKRKYPFLDIGVAAMPTPTAAESRVGEGAVSYANYWGLAVSRQSRYPEWAWDFIINFAANPQYANMYTEVSGLPPALRSLIGNYLNHAELGVFVRQALTARSWRVPDERRVSEYLDEAIAGVLAGRLNSYQALQQAQVKVSQLLQQN
jgi:multiple sugar transport system substrate-binding protein